VATQTKIEKAMLRQAIPGASVRSEPVQPPRPVTAEPIAQWDDNKTDRYTYLFWLICFGLMGVYVLAETISGLLF
jgi:hypothetical protein